MSMVEDVRQIFQDFLAPELRALATQVKANSEIAEAQGKLIQTQIEALTQRMEYLHRESMLRSETLEQKLTGRLDQVIQSFELEKRLARLESREITN